MALGPGSVSCLGPLESELTRLSPEPNISPAAARLHTAATPPSAPRHTPSVGLPHRLSAHLLQASAADFATSSWLVSLQALQMVNAFLQYQGAP